MADEAFHQEWYLFEPSIKNIFMLVIMANKLKCKIAKFGNCNLSLPSLMSVRFYCSCNVIFLCLINLISQILTVSSSLDFKSVIFGRSSVFKNEVRNDQEHYTVIPRVAFHTYGANRYCFIDDYSLAQIYVLYFSKIRVSIKKKKKIE